MNQLMLTDSIKYRDNLIGYQTRQGSWEWVDVTTTLSSVLLACGHTLSISDGIIFVRSPHGELQRYGLNDTNGLIEIHQPIKQPSSSRSDFTSLEAPVGTGYREFLIETCAPDGRTAIGWDRCDFPNFSVLNSGSLLSEGELYLFEEEANFRFDNGRGSCVKTFDRETQTSYVFVKKEGEANRYIYMCKHLDNGDFEWYQLFLMPTSTLPTKIDRSPAIYFSGTTGVALAKTTLLFASLWWASAILPDLLGDSGFVTDCLIYTGGFAKVASLCLLFLTILFALSYAVSEMPPSSKNFSLFEGGCIEFGKLKCRPDGVFENGSGKKVTIAEGESVTLEGYKLTGLADKNVLIEKGHAMAKIKLFRFSLKVYAHRMVDIPDALRADFSKRDPMCVFMASWPEESVAFRTKWLNVGQLKPNCVQERGPYFQAAMEHAGIVFDSGGGLRFGDTFVTFGELFSQVRIGNFLVSKSSLHLPANHFCVRIVDDEGHICLYYAYRESEYDFSWWQYALVSRKSIGNRGYID